MSDDWRVLVDAWIAKGNQPKRFPSGPANAPPPKLRGLGQRKHAHALCQQQRVIACLAKAAGPLTVAEIAKEIHAPAPRVYDVILRLRQAGTVTSILSQSTRAHRHTLARNEQAA